MANHPSREVMLSVINEAVGLMQVFLGGAYSSTLSAAHVFQMALQQPVQFARLLWAVVGLLLRPQADLHQMTRQLVAMQLPSRQDELDRSPRAPDTPPRPDT